MALVKSGDHIKSSHHREDSIDHPEEMHSRYLQLCTPHSTTYTLELLLIFWFTLEIEYFLIPKWYPFTFEYITFLLLFHLWSLVCTEIFFFENWETRCPCVCVCECVYVHLDEIFQILWINFTSERFHCLFLFSIQLFRSFYLSFINTVAQMSLAYLGTFLTLGKDSLHNLFWTSPSH